VSFFDIRAAERTLQVLEHRRDLVSEVRYSLPVSFHEAEKQQGTLVVFNLDPHLSNDDLMRLFSQFGPVREIRNTPNKNHQRFIEYFDARHADAAMTELNKKEICGRKLKIEPSHPGGSRKEHMDQFNRMLIRLRQTRSAPVSPRLQQQPQQQHHQQSYGIGPSVMNHGSLQVSGGPGVMYGANGLPMASPSWSYGTAGSVYASVPVTRSASPTNGFDYYPTGADLGMHPSSGMASDLNLNLNLNLGGNLNVGPSYV
jgi:hypothetical protein